MVGADRQGADAEATDVSVVDANSAKAVSVDGAVTRCAERADSITAV